MSAILGRIKEESIDAALQPVEADPLSRVLINPSIPDTIGKYGTSLQPVEADPLSRVLTKPSIPDTIGKYGTSLQPVEADPLSRVLTNPSIPDTNTIGKYIRGAVKFNPECVNNRILVHITRLSNL